MVLIDKANVGVNLCQAQVREGMAWHWCEKCLDFLIGISSFFFQSTDPCNNKLMSNLDFAQGNKQETATSASDKWPFECKRPTNGEGEGTNIFW